MNDGAVCVRGGVKRNASFHPKSGAKADGGHCFLGGAAALELLSAAAWARIIPSDGHAWVLCGEDDSQGTQGPRERFEKLRRGIHSGPLEGRPQITGPTAPHHIGFATLVDLLACQSAIGLRETAQVARRGHVQRADQRLLMPGFELPTLGSLRSFAALLLSEATAPRRPCPAGRLASGRAASIDAGLGNCRRSGSRPSGRLLGRVGRPRHGTASALPRWATRP